MSECVEKRGGHVMRVSLTVMRCSERRQRWTSRVVGIDQSIDGLFESVNVEITSCCEPMRKGLNRLSLGGDPEECVALVVGPLHQIKEERARLRDSPVTSEPCAFTRRLRLTAELLGERVDYWHHDARELSFLRFIRR